MITVKSAEFLYSRTSLEHTNFCEVCFCGRSNVGKSSLINMLVGQKKLARTSSAPGHTRLINYFLVVLRDSETLDEKQILFVDLPGYGYARVSKESRAKWDSMIDEYVAGSNTLRLCISLVDSKIGAQASDITLASYLYQLTRKFVVVGTKVDKLNFAQKERAISSISSTLKIGRDDVIMSSSSGTGRESILARLYSEASIFELDKSPQL